VVVVMGGHHVLTGWFTFVQAEGSGLPSIDMQLAMHIGSAPHIVKHAWGSPPAHWSNACFVGQS
jgi:hypothetical protein